MKRILWVITCTAICVALHAQVTIGPKAGINYANMVGADAGGSNSLIGLYAGVQTNIPVRKIISFQPEVVYSSQGAVFVQSAKPKIKMHLNYITVPVMAKFSSASGLFAETGPQFSLLMNANAKVGKERQNVKMIFKDTDFSWAFGLGYITKAGTGLNVRYNAGINKIDSDGQAQIKNGVLQAGIFIMVGGYRNMQ